MSAIEPNTLHSSVSPNAQSPKALYCNAAYSIHTITLCCRTACFWFSRAGNVPNKVRFSHQLIVTFCQWSLAASYYPGIYPVTLPNVYLSCPPDLTGGFIISTCNIMNCEYLFLPSSDWMMLPAVVLVWLCLFTVECTAQGQRSVLVILYMYY